MAEESPEREAERRIAEAARTGATELDLSDLGLTSLPEALFRLTQLQSLNLSGNQLSPLPELIWRLTTLESLDLSRNELSELPEAIGQLTALRFLYLFHNQLSALPEAIGELAQLQSLFLSGNRLSALPEAIGTLDKLQTLDLTENRFSALPEVIGKLSQVAILYLDDNQLNALPEALNSLGQLNELYLHGNDALNIPPDVLGPTWRQVRGGEKQPANPADVLAFYFRSRTEATRPLNEAKILIVGQAGVGKTSLVKRLKYGQYDPHERTTEGISIEDWSVPLEADAGNGAIKVNIWDFGGQEIMHATHQFFLTTRSLYLVVLDARKGEDESRLHTWLKIVESYGGGSPIIVVINKCEPPHWLELNERRLRRDYPNIQAFMKVSCETRAGVNELKQVIQDEVRSLLHVADPMPVSFFDLKRDLEARNRDYLTLAEYKEACRAHGVAQERDQESYLRILHVLGSMLNYDDPDSPYQLRDTNVLKPDWVTDGVYRILNNNTLMQAHGVLDTGDLGSILTDHARFPPDRHRFIIEMMRKFELCFDFPDVPGRLLIPELLSPNEPDLNWPPGGTPPLDFEYHYNALPSGLLSRFIVRMHHAISKQTYWRSGVLLDIEGNKALVRAHEHAAKIYISISGPEASRRSALSVIRNEFRAIHGTVSALEAAEKVALPEDPETLLDYEELLALERDRFEYIPRKLSDGTTRRIYVKQLLDGITPPETRELEQRGDEYKLREGYKQRNRARRPQAEDAAPHEDAPRPQPKPQLAPAQQHQPTWERVATPVLGLGLVAGLVAIALFVPEPTKFQILVFRVVLAIGAGALGALIPGFIEVSFKNWLRAGGATALFVIVYLVNPPALIAEGATPPEAPPSASAE